MRTVPIIALSLGVAGVARAQMQPIQPISPIPPIPGAPRQAVIDPFKPYKPPAYLNPTAPSSAADPYPHLRHTPGVVVPEDNQATPADPYSGLRKYRHRTPKSGF